ARTAPAAATETANASSDARMIPDSKVTLRRQLCHRSRARDADELIGEAALLDAAEDRRAEDLDERGERTLAGTADGVAVGGRHRLLRSGGEVTVVVNPGEAGAAQHRRQRR